MRSILLTAIGLVIAANVARAEQPAPIVTAPGLWTGGYVGAHVGVGTTNFDGVFDSSTIDRPGDNEDAVLGRFFELNGGLAGGHIGYNVRRGRLVYGIEADWSSFDPSDRLFDPEDEGPNGSTTDNASVELNWLASLRARLGLTSGHSLLFATAGLAWVDGQYTARDDDGAVAGQIIAGTADIGAVGFVIGGGIEHALTPRVTVRLEGLYYGFDKRVDTSALNNDSDAGDFAKIEDIMIARIAASYRFGGPATVAPISVTPILWSGLYAGGHAGYAHVGFDSVFDSSEIGNPFDTEDSVLGRFFDLNGGVGGVQVGYNRSFGRVLLGIEADWTGLWKSDRLFDPDGGNVADDSASVDLNWMASLRARFGLTSANTLFFATAGIGWINGDYTAVDNNTTAGSRGINDVGFVLGGGLEHALSNQLLVRLEGLHYDFGDGKDTSALTPDSDVGDFARIDDVTVFRVGISYKLNSGH